MPALLARVAGRLPIYAFPNTNRAHAAHLMERFGGTFGHFRKVFISSVIGLRKPEPAAFNYVIEAIGVPAGRILFFDDTLENVEGARKAGCRPVPCDLGYAPWRDTLAAIGLCARSTGLASGFSQRRDREATRRYSQPQTLTGRDMRPRAMRVGPVSHRATLR